MGIGCGGFEGPVEQKKGAQVTHNEERESAAIPELEKLRGDQFTQSAGRRSLRLCC